MDAYSFQTIVYPKSEIAKTGSWTFLWKKYKVKEKWPTVDV
jgi:hypothetical protein